jgi:hypothetical protein
MKRLVRLARTQIARTVLRVLPKPAVVLAAHQSPIQRNQFQSGGQNNIFPAGTRRLASLSIAPVQQRVPADVQFFGTLTVNDGVAIRVFAPFGGRTRKIILPGRKFGKSARAG